MKTYQFKVCFHSKTIMVSIEGIDQFDAFYKAEAMYQCYAEFLAVIPVNKE